VFKGTNNLKSLDNKSDLSSEYSKLTAGKFVKPGSRPSVDLGFP